MTVATLTEAEQQRIAQLDDTCDHDIGKPCREIWRTDAASWCPGCQVQFLLSLIQRLTQQEA